MGLCRSQHQCRSVWINYDNAIHCYYLLFWYFSGQDTSWSGAKKLLTDSAFLSKLLNYDKVCSIKYRKYFPERNSLPFVSVLGFHFCLDKVCKSLNNTRLHLSFLVHTH